MKGVHKNLGLESNALENAKNRENCMNERVQES